MDETVRVYSNPIADFEFDDFTYSILEPVVSIENLSVGGYSWLWNFGDSSYSERRVPLPHQYENAGTFNVSLSTKTNYGCMGFKSKSVTIEDHQTFFIPESFTPNGDGLNDLFEIKGEELEYVRMWIYDRWGQELHYGKDAQAFWDGTLNGKPMPIGAYAYIIEYKHKFQPVRKATGNVVITRMKN